MNTSPLPSASSASPSAINALRRALFTCAGIIFVSTAILMAGQRLFFDLHESAHGGPIGKPGIYAVGMLFVPFLGLWALMNLIFSIRICTARFPSWKLAAVLSLLAFTLSLLFILLRDLRFLLPAVILRRSLGLPAGGYAGPLMQFLLGAFLLGWCQTLLRKIGKKHPPLRYAVELIRSVWNRRNLPLNTFNTSTPTIQTAVTLTALALISFAIPFIWTLGLGLYAHRFGVFWLLYLILAVLATVTSILASLRSEWRHPFSARRLLFSLYGLPVVLSFLVAGWAMKR